MIIPGLDLSTDARGTENCNTRDTFQFGPGRPHGVKVVCLVSHPSGGSSELACAMRINLVIQIILAC